MDRQHSASLIALIPTLLCCSLAALPIISVHGRGPTGLRVTFYARSCPNAESIVREVVQNAVAKEARMAGSLLRLHFHDCFVQGCDGSVLLDSIPGVLEGEHSLRGFDVVDDIKAALERQCPGVVSCADVLAMAARDSVFVSGGLFYHVLLGRRDGLSASRSLANQFLPSFNFNVSDLVANFAAVGLSASDMVVLSGGHTIGKAKCATFSSRLQTPTTDLASSYRDSLLRQCRSNSDTYVNLDVGTPTLFDNRYYTNLVKGRGLLHSDEVLYSTPGATHDQVTRYSNDQASFLREFAAAMIKMGNIAILTGTQGQVRTHCGAVNR